MQTGHTKHMQSALLLLENQVFKYKVVTDIKDMSTEIGIDSGNTSLIEGLGPPYKSVLTKIYDIICYHRVTMSDEWNTIVWVSAVPVAAM